MDFCFLLSFLLIAAVDALPHSSEIFQSLPAFFLLAGDSTTATQNAAKTGGGWGDGFLNYTLNPGSSGQNFGHNGATTVSFRAGGDWDNVLDQVASHKASYNVFVTIQFGHNDQKPAANISLTQYTQNLINFANEARLVGAVPILVTPLTRRSFNESYDPPRIIENLAEQRIQTISAAKASGSWYIDLNKASTDYCNAIGEEASWEYNLTPTDNTHLNVHGSVVFGRLVSDLLVDRYPEVGKWTKPDPDLSALIAAGKPAK